jgi:hypothetical protein
MTKRGRLRPTVHLQRVVADLKRMKPATAWQVNDGDEVTDTSGGNPAIRGQRWQDGGPDGTVTTSAPTADA